MRERWDDIEEWAIFIHFAVSAALLFAAGLMLGWLLWG